jgi:hypothetical protein
VFYKLSLLLKFKKPHGVLTHKILLRGPDILAEELQVKTVALPVVTVKMTVQCGVCARAPSYRTHLRSIFYSRIDTFGTPRYA